jgi:hypothetical protein
MRVLPPVLVVLLATAPALADVTLFKTPSGNIECSVGTGEAPDRVTPRRDILRLNSLARDIRPDRVTPRRDTTARSLARDIRPDRVTTVARAGHSPIRVSGG